MKVFTSSPLSTFFPLRICDFSWSLHLWLLQNMNMKTSSSSSLQAVAIEALSLSFPPWIHFLPSLGRFSQSPSCFSGLYLVNSVFLEHNVCVGVEGKKGVYIYPETPSSRFSFSLPHGVLALLRTGLLSILNVLHQNS